MSTESTQTCPYILGCRVDHLGMSSLSGSLFLKEIDSPSLGRLGLPVTLQLGLGPCQSFPSPWENVDWCGLTRAALLLRVPMGNTSVLSRRHYGKAVLPPRTNLLACSVPWEMGWELNLPFSLSSSPFSCFCKSLLGERHQCNYRADSAI